MKLYIDTRDNKKTKVGLDDKIIESPAKENKSQQLLPLIQKILDENKKDLKDLTEIKVEVGPGSFTGIKIGVAVANALGWALEIPVNGQKQVEPRYEE